MGMLVAEQWYKTGNGHAGNRTVVYSLVMDLLVADISIQSNTGPVGSRTVV